jgi:hypothetical protein
MRYEVIAVLLVVLVIAGAGAGYLMGDLNVRTVTAASVNTTTATTVLTVHASSTQTVQRSVVSLLNLSGTYYWAVDVSKDTVIGMPGYSYFRNESVTFDGVKFQTICPQSYRDCPGSNSSSTIVYAGAIRFSMTFPDNATETTGDVIGDSIFTLVLSQHQPRAGMLIEYVNDYGGNSVDYAVFLLVSSCGQSPYVC